MIDFGVLKAYFARFNRYFLKCLAVYAGLMLLFLYGLMWVDTQMQMVYENLDLLDIKSLLYTFYFSIEYFLGSLLVYGWWAIVGLVSVVLSFVTSMLLMGWDRFKGR